MLSTLFPKYYPRYESSCCASELVKFGTWLLDSGYSRKNTCGHLRRFRSVFEPTGQSIFKEFSVEHLTTLFAVRQELSWHSHLNAATRRVYERFLHSENRLIYTKPALPACVSCLEDYERFLREVRGFADTTTAQHRSTVSEFLIQSLRSTHSVADLTSEHVEQYLAVKSREITRQTMQHIVARLRAFLRYSFDLGLVIKGLDRIDTPRAYRDEKPPRALPWPLVLKLLCSIDRNSKVGWRDYTILYLMAHYGLRPSEVAALSLDSVDFENKRLHIEQRKTKSQLVLPMNGSTIQVLQRYLQHGRIDCTHHTELFLRVRRPSGGIKHYAVCEIFKKRALQCGLPAGKYSSYSLRHAFAMRLLQSGVGVKSIGDLLGHRSLESTCVYLRLDIKTLRTVALPVPRQTNKGD